MMSIYDQFIVQIQESVYVWLLILLQLVYLLLSVIVFLISYYDMFTNKRVRTNLQFLQYLFSFMNKTFDTYDYFYYRLHILATVGH